MINKGLNKTYSNSDQEQPFTYVMQNKCSKKSCKIHKKKSVARIFFNKAGGLRPENLLRIQIQDLFETLKEWARFGSQL